MDEITKIKISSIFVGLNLLKLKIDYFFSVVVSFLLWVVLP